MTSQKVGASQSNARAASFENAVSVSKTPQTPHGNGGGYTDIEITNDISIDNHQSMNHNHCSLKECEPFTEHQFPQSVLDHVQYHFFFEDDGKALTRYGADVMNKAVAIMKVKIQHENLLDWCKNIGAYYRSVCDKVLKRCDPPTGEERREVIENLKRHATPNKPTPQRASDIYTFYQQRQRV